VLSENGSSSFFSMVSKSSIVCAASDISRCVRASAEMRPISASLNPSIVSEVLAVEPTIACAIAKVLRTR
jgi:hypothetical protein